MKVLGKLFRRDPAPEAPTMPSPQRSPAPPPLAASQLTPVPPVRRLTPMPPPLPGPPALAVARVELEDSVDQAFEQVVVRSGQAEGPPPASAATVADLAAVHGTYFELAVEYCAPVRNL